MHSITKICRLLPQRNIISCRPGVARAPYFTGNLPARQCKHQIYHQLVRSTTCRPQGKTKPLEEEEFSRAPYYKNLARKQRKFQVKDGVPIYLKGGAMDKILYQTTLVLCWIGMFITFKALYDLSYGKLKKRST